MTTSTTKSTLNLNELTPKIEKLICGYFIDDLKDVIKSLFENERFDELVKTDSELDELSDYLFHKLNGGIRVSVELNNYSQDFINTLDNDRKVELFNELYSFDSKNEIGWGCEVEHHPVIDEDDEIMEDFKLLYINKGLVQGVGVTN